MLKKFKKLFQRSRNKKAKMIQIVCVKSSLEKNWTKVRQKTWNNMNTSRGAFQVHDLVKRQVGDNVNQITFPVLCTLYDTANKFKNPND